jgi:hypothetical protein
MEPDAVLGSLTEDGNSLKGIVDFGGSPVGLTIDPDGGDPHASVAVARWIVGHLKEIDVRAKAAAAASLLETYNEGWRNYQEADGKGQLSDVTNPPLSEARFIQRLHIDSLHVLGDSIWDLFYADDGMFWGHSIVVTSFTASEFTDLHVELFG